MSDEIDPRQCGKRVRKIREGLELSAMALAKLVDMREEYLIAVEDGQRVHLRTYQKISDALGVNLAVILGETELPIGASLQSELSPSTFSLVRLTLGLSLSIGVLVIMTVVMGLAG